MKEFNPPIITRRFCGLVRETLPDNTTVMCHNEAVGEISGMVEDINISLPVCQEHLDVVSDRHSNFSIGKGVIL